MKSNAFALFRYMVLVGIIITIGSSCANPIAPSGGPRDSLPPRLVSAVPPEGTKHFAEKKISFSFNEYVDLDNWRDNLIISPLPKTEPVIESRLHTVTIRIKDTLEANTTYSYNFGNAIKDVNEGNVLKNFTYVFSTGSYIDSLELSGLVLNAQTGKPDSTLVAILHRSGDDSAVIKQKPRYFTRLDSAGHFHFRNLPPGVFYLYALKDQAGLKKYLSKEQIFAFADRPVTIGTANTPDTLYAYLEKQEVKKPAAGTRPAGGKDKDREKEKDKRLKFSMNLDNGQQDLLGNLEFNFADPLKRFDSSRLRLTDEAFKPVAAYRLEKDSSNKKITLRYKWPESTVFNLVVDRDFAEDSSGRRIPRNDTLRFRTMKVSDYGSLSIRFNNLDFALKPVLQLFQGESLAYSAPLSNRDFRLKLFKPGEYEIRILFDSNGNGVWDTGAFFGKHQQPEKVVAFPQKLQVKANWDNDITLQL